MDVKQAVASSAPVANGVNILRDHARRVVEGTRHLPPFLAEIMRASRLMDTPMSSLELPPPDLKLVLAKATTDETLKVAAVMGCSRIASIR